MLCGAVILAEAEAGISGGLVVSEQYAIKLSMNVDLSSAYQNVQPLFSKMRPSA